MPKLLAVPNIDKYAHLIREQRKVYFYLSLTLQAWFSLYGVWC